MKRTKLDYIISEQIYNLKKQNNLLKEDGGDAFYSPEVQAKIEKAHKRDGEDISASDEDSLRRIMQSPFLDIKQFALKCYPDHTPEGAQSQLNKEINGDTTDGGSEYHLKERTAAILRKCLNNLASEIHKLNKKNK